jgi:DNA (cytosine-5)-methyltransferase 1
VCDDIELVLNRVERGDAEIPSHDLLVGGFPCQDYSVAKNLGSALGLVGMKGVLWWQIYRLLRLKRPRLFFLENVDRLLKSPRYRRGRDFAVMLSALAGLDYEVEWRVVNAADYGFPQKRRRVLIVGRQAAGKSSPNEALYDGVLARSLPVDAGPLVWAESLELPVDTQTVSDEFGVGGGPSPFRSAGYMNRRKVWTLNLSPRWDGRPMTLGDILEPMSRVPQEYVVSDEELPKWEYLKGSKREERTHRASRTSYFYTEGSIPFPDRTDGPARTILTGEGGRTPSRFKHIINVDGQFRRLTPRELERLNGFPDDWTATGMPDTKRAFMMGNALVVGLVEMVGRELLSELG